MDHFYAKLGVRCLIYFIQMNLHITPCGTTLPPTFFFPFIDEETDSQKLSNRL